jgi:hypothetical protein
MRVDELNRAAVAVDAASAKTKSVAGKTAKLKPGREAYSIVGSESGSSYYLNCPNDEIMFNRAEMGQLVKIANGKGTDLEIRERLFTWFAEERRDVFSAIHIANKFDDSLKMLAGLIKKSFKTSG